MKDKEIIIVNGREYEYHKTDDVLKGIERDAPAVICPKCHNDTFEISYGHYECIALCKCGHSMTIYAG